MAKLLDQDLGKLPGVGYRISANLRSLGLETVRDLLYHFPNRYDDFRAESSIIDVELGVPVTLSGQIWTIKNVFTRNRKRLTQALFNDGTNSIELVWFNSHWLTNQLHGGDQIRISGKVERSGGRLKMVMPVWEKLVEDGDKKGIHTGRLVPIYPETEGLTSKWIRGWVAKLLPEAIKELEETLPQDVLADRADLREAISQMHFPTDFEKLEKSRRRLAFEELFYIQLATQKVRREWMADRLIESVRYDRGYLEGFIARLNFCLTGAQMRVIDEAIKDLEGNHPMNRLVQGDVGSGKTVVAASLMYLISQRGLRSVLMAPTEVLALQHFESLKSWLTPLGLKVGIQTGSEKSIKQVKSAKPRFDRGELESNKELPDVVVGTHALIARKFNLDKIGLVVVDEQHRFGVNQRNRLREMAQIPHFLSMTATPIPRTVALTMYGDLDISVIDEMPQDRLPVKTYLVPKEKRGDSYKFIDKKIDKGDQVFFVVPLIEDSESLVSVKAVKSEYEKLKVVFDKRRIGLLHGRQESGEKSRIIQQFRDKKLDILVSTSVIEVGVDVPNASIMVIEGAERFGLASLHQLRGRVGRGNKESFCFLFVSEGSEAESERLKTLTMTNSGLKLAEIDLKLRGGGEVFGNRQSGRFELKIANLADLDLIEEAKKAAIKLLDEDSRLDKYPHFKLKLEKLITNPSPD